MRGPDFGASRNSLYDAALDQVAWADELGFDAVGLLVEQLHAWHRDNPCLNAFLLEQLARLQGNFNF